MKSIYIWREDKNREEPWECHFSSWNFKWDQLSENSELLNRLEPEIIRGVIKIGGGKKRKKKLLKILEELNYPHLERLKEMIKDE